jgi:hypothetical protein
MVHGGLMVVLWASDSVGWHVCSDVPEEFAASVFKVTVEASTKCSYTKDGGNTFLRNVEINVSFNTV